MKLIYLTAKTYPATTADHIFVREMARAFTKKLNDDFTLVVANDFSEELVGIHKINLGLKIRKGLTAFFYCWIPYYIFRRKLNSSETIFFSVDPNLLSILIFYKKTFNLKYKIVSDWHMLFGDKMDSRISRNSDGLITTTEHLKSILVNRFAIPKNKISAVYGGVSLENFDHIHQSMNTLRNDCKLPLDSFLIGYVGFYKTMGMEKGLATMVGALALINDENVKMVFVGGKPGEIEEYRKIAEEKGVISRVIFIPMVKTDEVPSFEKAMDLLIIPYPDEPHFREYGFPMKVYEYMASKRPILYSGLSIISEVLGDCAISFKPGDAQDLTEKILYIKNDPIQGESLANKAYEKVADFTWDKRAENIIAIINLGATNNV